MSGESGPIATIWGRNAIAEASSAASSPTRPGVT
jgi:hypothetical protein